MGMNSKCVATDQDEANLRKQDVSFLTNIHIQMF